jgi:hypothetical protein
VLLYFSSSQVFHVVVNAASQAFFVVFTVFLGVVMIVACSVVEGFVAPYASDFVIGFYAWKSGADS